MKKDNTIKVSIAFSNDLFSFGVCGLLENMPSVTVTDLIGNGPECDLERIEGLHDNILLVDLQTLYNRLPDPEMTKKWPRVVLLDTDCGKQNIASAIVKKRLCGVVPVDADAELLLRMLEKVSAGEVWIDNKTVRNILDGMNNSPGKGIDALTKREREITALIGRGYRNKEIAKELNICEPTVKTHLYRIFQKLNIKSRSELIAIALKDTSPSFSTRGQGQ